MTAMRSVWAVALVVLVSCKAVLGLGDPVYEAVDSGQPNTLTDANDDAFFDAGVDPSTCDANTVIDPLNCGRCGHDCLGSDCQAGRCVPKLVGSVDDQEGASIFVVRDRVFYASDTQGIIRGDANGIAPDAGTRFATLTAPPDHLLVDGTYVVWSSTTTGVEACPIGGCTGSPLAVSGTSLNAGAVTPLPGIDTGFAYIWVDLGADVVAARGFDGGLANVSGTPSSKCENLTTSGATAFFANNGTVYAFSGDGGSVQSAVGGNACFIASANDRFVFADTVNVWSTVVRSNSTLSPIPLLLSQQSDAPSYLKTDGNFVYWRSAHAGGTQSIYRCSVTGCSSNPEEVVSGVTAGRSLEIDDAWIYYNAVTNSTEAKTEIWRVAK
jgi:hypothetical protein